ncbi:MAG: N-acetylglucosamine-6-phosphate deacetylase, partial [Planctomycetales bacterium]|nr:N-acetylglucosamine-6-phosphate deacetylase [Planctomycetales bacterium]
MYLNARRYDNGEPVRIEIDGERIAAVTPALPDGAVADWPYVAPGLFDLQINGYGGIWFSDAELTPEMVVAAVEPYFQFGVTRLFPTLITNSFEGLAGGLAAIRTACERHPWLEQVVAGCHVEGPYLSGEDGPRGAHPKQHIRDPNWDEFQKLQAISGGRIKLFTIAPEKAGAAEFIRRAVASGVTISIGHTAANGAQFRAAVE